jgi:hypothetical protein
MDTSFENLGCKSGYIGPFYITSIRPESRETLHGPYFFFIFSKN